MRILIVEDNVDLYNDYIIRIFGNLLPMDRLEIQHASKIEEAITNLAQPWDVILMDYNIGKPHSSPEGAKVRNGGDLVELVRSMEQGTNRHSFIIGTANNQVGNREMVAKGADTSYLKLHVVEMAREIEQRL